MLRAAGGCEATGDVFACALSLSDWFDDRHGLAEPYQSRNAYLALAETCDKTLCTSTSNRTIRYHQQTIHRDVCSIMEGNTTYTASHTRNRGVVSQFSILSLMGRSDKQRCETGRRPKTVSPDQRRNPLILIHRAQGGGHGLRKRYSLRRGRCGHDELPLVG